MIAKVLIKVLLDYGENTLALHVFIKDKKILSYVEDLKYLEGENNISEDSQGIQLIGSKALFKRVLEYFKGNAKVKLITKPPE